MRTLTLLAIVISMSTLAAPQKLPAPLAITDPKLISSKPNANVEQNQQSLSIERLFMTRSVGASTWSADGRSIAFVSNISGRNNIWLVLVFHGVDDIGWEALPHELLDTYFQFIKKHEDSLWIATFGDIARYIRERMNAKVQSAVKGKQIVVNLSHSLDTLMYTLPLTLKTYIPASWKQIEVTQGAKIQRIRSGKDTNGTYILYEAIPNAEPVKLHEE